jgi:hypothetical protein
MAGIVNEDVEAAIVYDHLVDAGLGRCIRSDVEFDAAKIDLVLGGVARHLGDLRRVAPGGFAHAGIDGVAGMSERAGGKRAEAARCAGDDDNLFHDTVPLIDDWW